ncbi:hypothetical protein KM043_015734 [Ampulex compressa]|nr:hypothetical protein KM043_015734 [Ampulex compressa]
MAPTTSVIFSVVIFVGFFYATLANSNYASARIESCSGCSLNRLLDVKQFIFQDVPLYKNVEFKHIQGATPELVLLNDVGEEVERLPLFKLTRQECNDLLASKGFIKIVEKDEI